MWQQGNIIPFDNGTKKRDLYVSRIYQYVTIMAEFVKKPLHSTVKNNEFTFYSDEPQDITLIEQLVIYATFLQDTVVKDILLV